MILELGFGERCLGSRRRETVGVLWLPEARDFLPFLGKGENKMKPEPGWGSTHLGS